MLNQAVLDTLEANDNKVLTSKHFSTFYFSVIRSLWYRPHEGALIISGVYFIVALITTLLNIRQYEPF